MRMMGHGDAVRPVLCMMVHVRCIGSGAPDLLIENPSSMKMNFFCAAFRVNILSSRFIAMRAQRIPCPVHYRFVRRRAPTI
ncbi:protein of unknown function (plasmid) [Caballeronia sp. S22]